MQEITTREQCTGCGACFNICPNNAIEIVKGIAFPYINQTLCVDCNICAKICPSNNEIEKKYPKQAFAVVNKDEEDRKTSATAGASSVFVKAVIEQGGVAFGCAELNYDNIRHICVESNEEAFKLKGSKYVQSNIGETYREAKNTLQRGRKVLFSGTPCQIAGLKSFLHHEYDNLITMEIVCFGNVTQQLLVDHVNYLREKHKLSQKNIQAYFRKKGGTTKELQYGTFLYSEGKLIDENISPNDYYHFGFRQGYYLRENCFKCRYAQFERCADILNLLFPNIKYCYY